MLTTKEISEMLRVSEETVRRWIRSGELAAKQDGKSYQVEDDWLNEFIQKKAEIPGTSLAKMQNLIEGLIGNPRAKENAAEFIGKTLSRVMQGADVFSSFNPEPEQEQEPENLEAQLETKRRQKKKLELEHQLKMLDIDEEIEQLERRLKNKQM